MANHNTGTGKEKRPLWERFWEKVDRSGGPDACWPWQARIDALGYGRIGIFGKNRFAYHASCMLHGIPIPGYPKSKNCIDHICGNRACVNPKHLRIVAQAQNCMELARPTPAWRNKYKTHCDAGGHEFTPENTHWFIASDGRTTRMCLACYRLRCPGSPKGPTTKDNPYIPRKRHG